MEEVKTPAVQTNESQALVELTPLAAQKLQEIMNEKDLAGHGLRVYISGGGCSGFQYGMAFENTMEEGDFVFDANGVRMYIDPSSAMYLEGATVDYVDSLMGGGFRIENPNAVSTCSCGQSFSAGQGEAAEGDSCGCGHHH